MIWLGSGHGIDPHVTPIYRRGGGGGGSFSSPPFVLRDGVYTYTGSGSSVNGIQFNLFNIGTLDTVFDGDFDFSAIPDVPLQYWEGLPAVPSGHDWSAREVEDLGGDPYDFTPAPTGDWTRLTSVARWAFLKPPASTTIRHTSVYELALTADLSDIRARATIEVVYVRP